MINFCRMPGRRLRKHVQRFFRFFSVDIPLGYVPKEEVFGIGLMEELARNGYRTSPGTLYPTLAKLEKSGYLTCQARTVDHKQRKYYRITVEGRALLDQMREKIEELYEEVIRQK